MEKCCRDHAAELLDEYRTHGWMGGKHRPSSEEQAKKLAHQIAMHAHGIGKHGGIAAKADLPRK